MFSALPSAVLVSDLTLTRTPRQWAIVIAPDAMIDEVAEELEIELTVAVGDVLLTARIGQYRNQLPPVLAPLVQDLLGGVDQQRDGGVLPPGRFAHAAELIGRRVLHG